MCHVRVLADGESPSGARIKYDFTSSQYSAGTGSDSDLRNKQWAWPLERYFRNPVPLIQRSDPGKSWTNDSSRIDDRLYPVASAA